MNNNIFKQIERSLSQLFENKIDQRTVILFFIILLGLFIRMYKIKGLDVGGAWDEGYSMIAASNIIGHNTFLLINHMPDDNGILLDKPPVLYILGALFMQLFGHDEISARVVSIIFGVLSIYAFFVLVNYITKERRIAIFSAFIFAVFPLHIALSRVFMGHVPSLFLTITSIYLLMKGVYEKQFKLLVTAGILVAANLLILMWFGILPVIGAMIWMFFYAINTTDREIIKNYLYAFLCVLGGFLIFLAWPFLLSLGEHKYYGFHGGCYLPTCDVWDMIFKKNIIDRLDLNRVGLDIIDRLSSPAYLYIYIKQIFSRPYLQQGHFDFSREFDLFYKAFLYFGIFVSLTRLNQRSMKKISLFWLFWFISYLPIQLGKNLYTQYLLLIVPFFSFYIAYGIYNLNAIQLNLFQNKRFLSLITILICLVFFLKGLGMVMYDKEYLYKTNYRKMAEYVRNKTTPSKVICTRYPGMSYYLGGECTSMNSVKEHLGEYIKNDEIEYVDIWRGKNLETLQRIGCENMNNLLGIPGNSEHTLFKCN